MSVAPPSDVAYRVLRLEQQLDSYQRLHAEELEQIRQALAELKNLVLGLAQKEVVAEPGDEAKSA
jgi:exopolyphosphatase/pppGpp-phosphohydrolase